MQESTIATLQSNLEKMRVVQQSNKDIQQQILQALDQVNRKIIQGEGAIGILEEMIKEELERDALSHTNGVYLETPTEDEHYENEKR